jgi:hypothetical protein
MRVPLSDLDLMPPSIRSALSGRRIRHTRQLLNAAAWPDDRRRWLKKAGVSESELRPWLVAADLCRIEGMPPQLAQRLALSGEVDSVQALGQVSAAALLTHLRERAAQSAAPADLPGEEDLAHLIGVAQTLAPRLIWDAGEVDHFDDILQAAHVRSLRRHRRDSLKYWLLFVSLPAAIFLVFALIADREIASRAAGLPDSFGPYVEASRGGLRVLVGSTSVFAALWLVPTAPIIQLLETLRSSVRKILLPRLVRGRSTRRLALLVQYGDDSLTDSVDKYTFLGLVLLTALALITMVITPLGESVALANKVVFIGTAFGVVFGIAWVTGDTVSLTRQLRGGAAVRQAALLRFLLYRLIDTISGPVMVYLAVVSLLFLGNASNRWVGERVFAPLYEAQMAEVRAAFEGLPAQDKARLDMDSETFLNTLETELTPRNMWFPDDAVIEVRSVATTITVWLLLVPTVGYFLVPYILMQRFKEVASFIVIAVLASLAESALTRLLGSTTGLPAGSVLGVVLLFVVIVFNAAAFETVEALGTDDTEDEVGAFKLCSACGKPLPAQARYCLVCGAQQPERAKAGKA